ncbi:MAG TPA: VWA domain-containing protein [Leptospiraceae bacterium]|nr:VWA domain-containing protein [Leptospiraceae bacterium]HNF14675.1 VWA domain-containing protein [Leptospiraceae bacterium]HNI26853.1 VWA domain-containing protein [Leptospiraceae bacterium]HNI96321.1 VWA domain-containing protein [Leptospiraceae bacterium]
MFAEFFYRLRAKKVPVSTTEYLDMINALKSLPQITENWTVSRFYSVARSCLAKDIRFYDDFDIVFAQVFGGLNYSDEAFRNLLKQWLDKASDKELSEENKKNAPLFNEEELMNELKKRMEEQKERHDGGNKWIGTKGVSPYGHSGYNEFGIRINGESGGRSAIGVIEERKYKEYRTDASLNVRQIKVALKKLKDLRKEGRKEFSIQKTIDRTVENGGDLDLVFAPSRKNRLKLMLLMDVGGSMTPYAEKVSRLFSAAHQLNHFKEFHYYYFHNIIYDYVYQDAYFQKKISLNRLTKKIASDTKVVFVGDASMNPYELFGSSASYYSYFHSGKEEEKVKPRTGIEALKFLLDFYDSSVWVNPDDERYWTSTTCEAIWDNVPMFFLSVDGISRAMKKLMSG